MSITCISNNLAKIVNTIVLQQGNLNYVKPGLMKPKTRVAFQYI